MRAIVFSLVLLAASAAAADTIANPVIDRDFPDPDTLRVGETVYAYATNVPGKANVQAARSTDLRTWEALPDILPNLPDWARSGLTWAPEVAAAPAGGYVLYFTARDIDSNRQCIGVATAASPEGPFASDALDPLICQADEGGSIDAASFLDDDGRFYLLWKNDGNCCGRDTWLYIQEASPDGLELLGSPTRLIRQDQEWEGHLVEAPTLWKEGGRYYLLYSANNYASADYAIGWAVSDNLAGPYTKAEAPLLTTRREPRVIVGPGGQDIVRDEEGRTWLVYHSWNRRVTYRNMHIDPIVWEDGTPAVHVGP